MQTLLLATSLLSLVAPGAVPEGAAGPMKRLGAEATGEGVRVRFSSDSFFEPGKADLRRGAKQAVQDVVALVRLWPECRVRIESHTDGRGAREFNARLSQARAERLKRTLEGQGLNNVYEARHHGEERPLSGDDTAEGRARNRRVEVHVLVPHPPPPRPAGEGAKPR